MGVANSGKHCLLHVWRKYVNDIATTIMALVPDVVVVN